MTEIRTRCLNPRCRRTYKQEHEGEEVVCGKCWRTLPLAWRQRHKALRARGRKIERLLDKADYRQRGDRHPERSMRQKGAAQAWIMWRQHERLFNTNWQRIRAFFLAPERPPGLDAFLEEMGL